MPTRLVAPLALLGLSCLLVVGCCCPLNRFRTPPSTASSTKDTQDPKTDEGSPSHTEGRPSGRLRSITSRQGVKSRGEGSSGIEPIQPMDFAYEGYDLVLTHSFDYEGDGWPEYVLGLQSTETDELGGPVYPAYLVAAMWTGEEWTQWFSIEAPQGETILTDQSLVFLGETPAGDQALMGVYFYTIAASGLPKNFYAWRIEQDQLVPALTTDFVELSSLDEVFRVELEPSWEGEELVFAFANIGDSESQVDPHRYTAELWAWNGEVFEYMDSVESMNRYRSASEAIQVLEVSPGNF